MLRVRFLLWLDVSISFLCDLVMRNHQILDEDIAFHGKILSSVILVKSRSDHKNEYIDIWIPKKWQDRVICMTRTINKATGYQSTYRYIPYWKSPHIQVQFLRPFCMIWISCIGLRRQKSAVWHVKSGLWGEYCTRTDSNLLINGHWGDSFFKCTLS